MNAFFHRMAGAVLFDARTFEEVEADRSATPQALVIVVASSLAAGIGARGAEGPSATLAFFAAASVLALLAWAAWALTTYEIGTHVLPAPDTRGDPDELLRTLGFAAAPGLIQAIGVFPEVRTPAFVLAIVWSLAASVLAVKQSLDYGSLGRALAVCVLGAGFVLVSALVLGLAFSPTLSGSGGVPWNLI
jgi:hypothetical protein